MEKVKHIHSNDVGVGGTTSSTGSNNVIIGEELADDATSNSFNQHKFQPKVQSVGYIFKLSDGNSDEQQRDQNNLLIAQTDPYDSNAESALRTNERKYTPKMISDELVKLGLDQYTFLEAYDMLVHNAKELELFLGLPPKFRRGWMKRRIPISKDLDIEEIPCKKRKINGVWKILLFGMQHQETFVFGK